MKSAYYNEFDPQKAAWLRELIKAGLVAPGEVDERSINDVNASELMGYTQCHFFAGIGVWSYALRLARWPDERPVWTGSCPCPSFSVAGKGEGFADPRHLWPVWFNLIRKCGPGTIFGEQADGAVGHGWLDLVSTDMEAEEYAFAAAVLGAHSAGAPHIRQRLYFCADSAGSRRHDGGRLYWRCAQEGERTQEAIGGSIRLEVEGSDSSCCGAKSLHSQRRPQLFDGVNGCNRTDAGRKEAHCIAGTRGEVCTDALGVEIDAKCERLQGHFGHVRDWRGPGWLDPLTARSVAETGATSGFWRDCDWWFGRDEKYRPIGPGVQPLAHGVTARVVKLRGYGDAIVSETAAHFIAAAMEVLR